MRRGTHGGRGRSGERLTRSVEHGAWSEEEQNPAQCHISSRANVEAGGASCKVFCLLRPGNLDEG